MPRIARLDGMVIAIYFDDHPPPHFHARTGELDAQVAIDTGLVLEGSLPRRARRRVRRWALRHRAELEDNWRRARAGEPLATIASSL